MFGRRRRDAQTIDAIRAQLAVADEKARGALADAIAQVELRLSRDLARRERFESSSTMAMETLQRAVASNATEATSAIEQLARACALLAERLEADLFERRALSEAVARMARALNSPAELPSRVTGGTIFASTATPRDVEISLADEDDDADGAEHEEVFSHSSAYVGTVLEGLAGTVNGHGARVLDAGSSDPLTIRAEIAVLTGECGEVREALALCRELLPDQESELGADHPDTLTTRANIAAFTGECGDVEEALRLCRELLVDRTRVLGADHPDTLTTRNDIAVFTGECGDVLEALELCRELLPDRVRVLGADHPDTLTTRHDLAAFTAECGDVTEALELCRELLVDQVRLLGADHPDTLATRNDVNGLESAAGRD